MQSADEIYYYQQKLSLDSFTQPWAGPISWGYLTASTISTIYPDIKAMAGAVKAGRIDQIPTQFTKLQQDNRNLFVDINTKTAAYNVVWGDTYALGKIFKKKDQQSQATLYAQTMYVGYLAPAAIISLYNYFGTDGIKYINSSVNTMTQDICSNYTVSFQNRFQEMEQSNAVAELLMSQVKPNSLARMFNHWTMPKYEQFTSGGLDVLYAYLDGKAIVQGKGIDYNVCNYNTFQSAVASNLNPYAGYFNVIVNTLAKKTGYPVQNIYWMLIASSSYGLYNILNLGANKANMLGVSKVSIAN